VNSSFLARSAALRASLRQQGRVLLRVYGTTSSPSTRKPHVPGPGFGNAGDGRRAGDDFGRECEEIAVGLGAFVVSYHPPFAATIRPGTQDRFRGPQRMGHPRCVGDERGGWRFCNPTLCGHKSVWYVGRTGEPQRVPIVSVRISFAWQ